MEGWAAGHLEPYLAREVVPQVPWVGFDTLNETNIYIALFYITFFLQLAFTESCSLREDMSSKRQKGHAAQQLLFHSITKHLSLLS